MVHCSIFIVRCPQVVLRCITSVPMPNVPGQCGSILHQLHYPLPLGSGTVQCSISMARYPHAVWRCIIAVPLPNAPGQCGPILQQLDYPLRLGTIAVHCSLDRRGRLLPKSLP